MGGHMGGGADSMNRGGGGGQTVYWMGTCIILMGQ